MACPQGTTTWDKCSLAESVSWQACDLRLRIGQLNPQHTEMQSFCFFFFFFVVLKIELGLLYAEQVPHHQLSPNPMMKNLRFCFVVVW